ncbi:MAG: DNA alkylation repair protein [Coprobacillus sp.]
MNANKEILSSIMHQLEQLGKEQTKKTYMNHGAREPLFGVTTGALKPLAKKIGKDYELSIQLYNTGNYDAMYLAGMIADYNKMTKQDFEKWIQEAYCHGIANYTVAVTLAESCLAQELADNWIKSDEELYASAGWSCYEWLLGYKPDNNFDKEKILRYLEVIEKTIHSQPNWVKYAMNNFVISVGISYLPSHQEAIQVAQKIGVVIVDNGKTNCQTPNATVYIQRAIDKNRLGFKRRNVRC